MRYDVEYNSYKFSSEELSLILHGLIHYSSDPFVDHLTKQNIKILLERINESMVVDTFK